MGAEWTQITIRGDGQVTYRYRFPYTGTWPQQEITREHWLSSDETRQLFQSLVDAGLLGLRSQETQGADVPGTSVAAHIDGRSLDMSMDGTPDEAIHNQMRQLIEGLHPERWQNTF